MLIIKKLSILILFIVVHTFLLHGDEQINTIYNDPIFHYSVIIPEGWKRTPQKELQYMIEGTVKKIPRTSEVMSHLSVGFYLDGNYYFKHPFVYIYNYEEKLVPFDEIVKAHKELGTSKELMQLEKDSKHLLKEVKVEQPHIDEERKIIFRKSYFEVTGVGDVVAFGATCIGYDRYTFIYLYTLKSDSSIYLSVFQSIVESFEYDSGYTYDDKPIKESSDFEEILKEAAIPIVVSMIVVYLLGLYSRRRKKRLQKTNNRST